MLAGGGGAAALLRPGPGAAELLPADGTRAVQLQPGHDAPRVEAVPALQQPHLLALRQVLINRGDGAYKIVFMSLCTNLIFRNKWTLEERLYFY